MRFKSIRGKSIAERLWEKVERKPSGCWEFVGARAKSGYGSIKLENGRTHSAHRLAWMLHNQADPGPLEICHTCDNRPCCNPWHLYAGTAADNARDKVQRGRARGNRNRGEAHHRAKLNWAAVDEIRRLAAEGIGAPEVARRFGIHRSMAYKVIKGEKWNDMERAA